MAGSWIDSKTGKVVTSQPEEGVQLVSPNVEPNPNDEAAVQRAKDALKAEAEGGDGGGDSETTTSARRSASK